MPKIRLPLSSLDFIPVEGELVDGHFLAELVSTEHDVVAQEDVAFFELHEFNLNEASRELNSKARSAFDRASRTAQDGSVGTRVDFPIPSPA